MQAEMWVQGDVERKRDLKISPYCDRDEPQTARMSLNFVDFVVVPLYETLARLLPSVRDAIDRLVKNRVMWEQIIETEGMPCSPRICKPVGSAQFLPLHACRLLCFPAAENWGSDEYSDSEEEAGLGTIGEDEDEDEEDGGGW
jgi:3'5'-cyclic nucleotide phosphodiesterase family protein